MQVRAGTADDVAGVMEVVRRVVPLMRDAGNLQWDSTYPHAGVFLRDVERRQLWVAEDGGVVAGMVALTTEQEHEYAEVGWHFNEPSLVIHRLAVDPAYQGKGVAQALMRQGEVVAFEQGINVLRADTNTQNAVTRWLLPKMGYQLAGEIGLAFRPGLRFLCYEKRLTQPG